MASIVCQICELASDPTNSGYETALIVAISLITPMIISFYFAMQRAKEEQRRTGDRAPRATAGGATPKPKAKKAN